MATEENKDKITSSDCYQIMQALEVFAEQGLTADGINRLTEKGRKHILALRDLFSRLSEVEEEEDFLVYIYKIELTGSKLASD